MVGDVIIGNAKDGSPIVLPEWALERHSLIFGGSGFGKTFLAYVLAVEQLKRGASLVAIDPKRTTVRRLRGACHAAGIPPERVVLLDASVADAAPGMNPFRFAGGPAASATAAYDLFDKTGAITGDRIRAFLAQAFRLAAWHGLPFLDVLRILDDAPFRAVLLDATPLHPQTEVYKATVRYFRTRFASYDARERDSTVRSIETKFTELMGNDLFLRMFSARKNTVDFDRLFQEPGAVLVSMEAGHGLSTSGAQLLAGMTVHFLFDAARRQPGPVPVVLAVDEIRKLSGFLAEDLRDVVNMAREARIRLIAAGQHPGQLPPGVSDDLIASSAVKAFFNPGNGGADVARFLEANSLPTAKPFQARMYACTVGSADGLPKPLRADPTDPPPFRPLPIDLDDPDRALRRFMAYAPNAIPPLLTEDGTPVRDILPDLVAQGPRLVWRADGAYLETSEATVKPKRAWGETVNKLELGQAVMVIAGGTPSVVQVTRVAPEADAPVSYVNDSEAANAAPVDSAPAVGDDPPTTTAPDGDGVIGASDVIPQSPKRTVVASTVPKHTSAKPTRISTESTSVRQEDPVSTPNSNIVPKKVFTDDKRSID